MKIVEHLRKLTELQARRPLNIGNPTVVVNNQQPEPQEEPQPKFTFVDWLAWIQNWQILFYLITGIIGIGLIIIYPKIYPSGLPGWVEKLQELLPTSEIPTESENESD